MPLEHEFQFFKEHRDELVKQYRGRAIVIKGEQVLGAYDDELTALRRTSREREVGTFLIQRCEAGPECYTFTYHGCMIAWA